MHLNTIIERFPQIAPNLLFSSKSLKRKAGVYFLPHRIEKEDLIICLGIDESLYEKLQTWLSSSKALVFLEEDKRVVLSLSEKILQDERVKIHLIEGEDTRQIQKIVWEHISSEHFFVCHPELENQPIHKFVKEALYRYQLGKHLSISDVSDFGIKVFKNILHNHKSLEESKNGVGLENSFKKIPAIVCGAGPSLRDEIKKIKNIQNKALILAGGAALNVLAKEGIEPHFGGGVDKAAPFIKFQEHLGFLSPFFFQMRMSKENLSLIHHEPICFGEASGALFSKLLEENHSLKPFSSGWCVGNFLSQIAVFMGCDPIIFIGMDFSYTQGNKYGEGSDHYGNKRIVQKDFEMAIDFTESLAKKHQDRLFINASRPYEKSSFLKEFSFTEAFNKYLQKEFDLDGLIHQNIQECKSVIFNESLLEKLQISFLECKKLLAEGIEKYLSIEKKLKEEFSFQYIISPIWQVYTPLIFSKIHRENRGIKIEKIKKIHEYLFFQRVIDIYIKEITRMDNGR